MKVVTLTPGARGVDTVLVLNAEMCAALVREAVRFVVRYLASLSTGEVKTILDSGLALSVVTYAGVYDGPRAVAQALGLGLPAGTTIWLDLESCKDLAPTVIAKVNAWARTVKTAGYIPGLYVGCGVPLTSTELYALAVERYWHSCSRVTDRDGHEAAPSCGWAMHQLSPPNVSVGGVKVDIDFAQLDYRGRGVSVVVAS
jgi:hypothetical protein